MEELYPDQRSSTRLNRFLEGFKRDPNSTFVPSDYSRPGSHHIHGAHYYDLRLAALSSAHHGGLMRSLKGRHLQMIAMGGSIGNR